jgi:purine-binding chemotaxis protein CheW
METPFLEIPEGHFPPAGGGGKDENSLDIFDISYLLGLTEAPVKQDDSEKHIIFKLDEETFGIPLRNVLEVCRSLAVTSLPNVPGWLAGIANLRGSLLAVMDLQTADEQNSLSSKSKIIVLTDRQKQVSVGLLVDQIIEIAFLLPESTPHFPSPKSLGPRSFVSGKAAYQDSSLLVLDAQKLFSSPEFNQLQEH